MLKRIANNTTIHGVQDAWSANWVGRAFFISVFACCFTVMVFQLKGLFIGYITEAVGTRVTSTTIFDADEVPSIYYCNRHWVPTAAALWHYKPIQNRDSNLNESYDKIYQECVHEARYNKSFDLFSKAQGKLEDLLQYVALADEPSKYCKPYLEYWKSMIKQELVNAIIQPLGDWGSNSNIDFENRLLAESWRKKRPELSVITTSFAASILEDPIQSLLNSELRHGVQAFVENTVLNIAADGVRGHKSRTATYTSAGSVMTPTMDLHGGNPHYENFVFYLVNMYQSGFDPVGKYYEALSNSTLHPSTVSTLLDGVCLEYPMGPQYIGREGRVAKRHRHIVLHLGGLVHHLRVVGYRTLSPWQHSLTAFGYPSVVGGDYYTNVAVAKHKEPGLLFNQKIRVSDNSPLVSIKYWTNAYTYLNRKAWPCRPAPWTELDQAHCNQELSKTRREKIGCETYLPATRRYSETPITNHTCIYDHTGLFKDIVTAMSDVKFPDWTYVQPSNITRQLSSFGPSRVSYDRHTDVISRLTDVNPDCPRPCSQSTVSVQASYPSPNDADLRLCITALSYWLTPRTATHAPEFKSPGVWFHHIYWYMGDWLVRGSSPSPLCSVIEYERVDAQEHISEEYKLYGLSDLAANIGGTMGLWIGASVMSLVQIVYLCCLKKRFRKMRRRITALRSKQVNGKLTPKLLEIIQFKIVQRN